MQKRFGRIILIVIGAAMVGTILFFMCSRFIDNPFKEKNVLTGQLEKGQANEDNVSDTDAEEQMPYSQFAGVLPYPGNTVEIGKPFSVKGDSVEVCVNDAAFTKDGGDSDAVYSALQDTNYPYEFDENYNILNDFTYVVVNVTVKNTGQTENKFYLNTFKYVGIDPETEDAVESFYSGQMRGYKARNDARGYDKAYAQTALPAGGEMTCNLVFIQKDEDIEGKIPYMKFSPSGSLDIGTDKFSRYVRLKKE